jgi:hypothetical protein
MHSMIDAAKYADLVLLLIDAAFGFEMETFEFLNLLQVIKSLISSKLPVANIQLSMPQEDLLHRLQQCWGSAWADSCRQAGSIHI